MTIINPFCAHECVAVGFIEDVKLDLSVTQACVDCMIDAGERADLDAVMLALQGVSKQLREAIDQLELAIKAK
jgi:hypothetical protein